MTRSLQITTSTTSTTQLDRRRWALGAVGVLASAALTGCIVVPSGHPSQGPHNTPYPGQQGSPQVGPDGQVVGVAPPAPQLEVVVQAPGPAFFWIAGHWAWHLGHHVWIGGRWEGQRSGHHWVPHVWHRHSNGWRSSPGHWRRR